MSTPVHTGEARQIYALVGRPVKAGRGLSGRILCDGQYQKVYNHNHPTLVIINYMTDITIKLLASKYNFNKSKGKSDYQVS